MPALGIRDGPWLRPGQFQYLTSVHTDWSKSRVQNPSRVSLFPWGLTIRSLERTSPGSSSGIRDYKDEGNVGLLAVILPPADSQQPHFKLPDLIYSFLLQLITSIFCQLQLTDPQLIIPLLILAVMGFPRLPKGKLAHWQDLPTYQSLWSDLLLRKVIPCERKTYTLQRKPKPVSTNQPSPLFINVFQLKRGITRHTWWSIWPLRIKVSLQSFWK